MGILRNLRHASSLRNICALGTCVALVAVFAASAAAYTEVQDVFEPDNVVGDAKQLVLGAAKQQRTLHYNPPSGDVDWVWFNATAGKSYVIQTHDLSPATTDTVLRLYAPDGTTLLAENDDFGFSFASRIAWSAPETGTYYVKVYGRHAGVSGSYALTLREGGAITGRVTLKGTTQPIAGVTVDLWQWNQDGYYAMFETRTDVDGNYRFDAVPVGTWRVGFYDWEHGLHEPLFYNDKKTVELATNVVVSAGTTASGINAAMVAATSVPAKTYVNVDGVDRFATAVKASKTAYPGKLSPSGERTVVIATGRNWPDALGGTALAGVLDGPVLLVDTKRIPEIVMEEIRRLSPAKAVVLGGTSAVGEAVESALAAELGGADKVRRISGPNRYRTADEIAIAVKEFQGAGFDGSAFVATGENFPDALAAAPLAAAGGTPLYLADPKRGLRAETKTAMDGVSNVVVLGGTGAVSAEVETYLSTRFGSGKVERLDGKDRYETACLIASHGAGNGMTWDGAGVATGADFPDAMSGGAMLGKRSAVLLLTRPTALPDPVRKALSANKTQIMTVHFIGGTNAVSGEVRTAVKNALK